MKKVVGFAMLLTAVAGYAMAGTVAPEISTSAAAGGVTLVSGAILVLRSRRK